MINKFVTFASSVLTISNIYFLASFYRYYSGVAGISPPKGCRPPFRDVAPPPPLKFREFAPPPPSVFEILISYILLGSKTTAKRSAISIHAPIIRDVVNETHQEPITRSEHLPYLLLELSFLQTELFLERLSRQANNAFVF